MNNMARTDACADVLVLCYHAVDETWPAELSVTPQAFERQLDVLVERGYESVTFREAVFAPCKSRTVAITFDDAFRSVQEQAFPRLAERGFVGTVFVPTSFVDRGEPASWDGVAQWLGTEHEQQLAPFAAEQPHRPADHRPAGDDATARVRVQVGEALQGGAHRVSLGMRRDSGPGGRVVWQKNLLAAR